MLPLPEIILVRARRKVFCYVWGSFMKVYCALVSCFILITKQLNHDGFFKNKLSTFNSAHAGLCIFLAYYGDLLVQIIMIIR